MEIRMLKDIYAYIGYNFELAHPWVLTLWLLLPILAIIYFRKNKKVATLKVSTTHFLRNVSSFKTRSVHLPFYLRLLAMALLIFALAGPRNKFVESQSNGEGIDIMLCMDISGSMNASDFKPTRLEAAKRVATEFIMARPGDRIGITIFSIVSYTLCPITNDHRVVLQQMSSIKSGYLEAEGTAIGSGLATAVDGIRNSKAKSKVIILITDGVNIGGTIAPDIAIGLAKKFGVKVYTIGIGSSGKMNVSQQSEDGEEVSEDIDVDFNPVLLKNIAQETGGSYFYAKDNNALENVYAKINQLEKSKVVIHTFNRYAERFLPFLLIALVLLIVEFVLRMTYYRKFP